MYGPPLMFVAFYIMSYVVMGALATLAVLSVHTVMFPLVFKYCTPLRRKCIFMNCIQWPLYTDFEEPAKSGIEGGRSLYINHESEINNCNIKIGVWHILPKSILENLREKLAEPLDPVEYDRILEEQLVNSGKPIFMYCHGNSNSRAARARIHLYKVLQDMDVHVVTFDYRGYGDSTNVRPSEDGVVEDAMVVYGMLKGVIDKSENPPPVFIWGHSLGTGVTCHLVGRLEELCPGQNHPSGIILEAPFNNMKDEITRHPLAKLVRWLPYYEATIVRPIAKSTEYAFKSDEHLAGVNSVPVLILHAQDDAIVPYELGVKLFEHVSESRRESGAPVVLHTFEKQLNLGHKWICKADNLSEVVRDFMSVNNDVPLAQ